MLLMAIDDITGNIIFSFFFILFWLIIHKDYSWYVSDGNFKSWEFYSFSSWVEVTNEWIWINLEWIKSGWIIIDPFMTQYKILNESYIISWSMNIWLTDSFIYPSNYFYFIFNYFCGDFFFHYYHYIYHTISK